MRSDGAGTIHAVPGLLDDLPRHARAALVARRPGALWPLPHGIRRQRAPHLARAHAQQEHEPDELAAGPPTVTLRSAHALRPAHEDPQTRPRETIGSARVTPPPVEADDEDELEIDYDSRFAWDRPRKRPRALTALYVAAIPLLLVALAAQAIFHFRDALAAHWPQTRPALAQMCAATGCTVRPLRDVAALSIDASICRPIPRTRAS
jgi:hypothetical protein